MAWVAVAVGGAVGSLLRYGLAQLANLPGWPVGTWLANVIGSFAIGVLFVIGKERGGFSPELYLLFTTGMLGGFTTFSTFSLEVVSFWGEGQWLRSFAYALLSIGVGLFSCAAGIWLARQMQ